jgi:hypothetical protein
MIGSVVAIALVFASEVLGVAWTGKNIKMFRNTRIGDHDDFIQANLRNKPDSERFVLTYPVDQKLAAKKESKTSKFDSLINKKVYTCDNEIIGSIDSVYNGMLIVTHSISQGTKYEIPAYYIRQNYQTSLVMDVCAKDLDRYNPQLIITKQKQE